MQNRFGVPSDQAGVTRRRVIQGLAGLPLWQGWGSRWFPWLAAQAAEHPRRIRSCILLWMSGGPSQLETFDLKSGHAHGGPFKPIETAVPGIQISEHLPRMARLMQQAAIIRSMSTKEGDHTRAMQYLHTGYAPVGPIQYPTLGSLVSREASDPQLDLPGFISIGPARNISPQAHAAGYLGAGYSPMVVGSGNVNVPENATWEILDQSLKVEHLTAAEKVQRADVDRRLDLLQQQERSFSKLRTDAAILSHQSAYEKGARLMRSPAARVFKLDEEPVALREKYGRTQFGQACLLARRLVERKVPFVEVSFNAAGAGGGLSWDTHQNNFTTIKTLSGVLDAGWSALVEDLQARGVLDQTLIIWMGEFGRTPQINANQGRDHFPDAWSTVLCGGGIQGGRVVGKTSPDGMRVADRPVNTPDFLGTVCAALGIEADKEHISNIGRPIPIVDRTAHPIREILKS